MPIYDMPYTNIHSLNIDWLLKKVKDNADKIQHIYDNMDATIYQAIDDKLTKEGLEQYINNYLTRFTKDVYIDLLKNGFRPNEVKHLHVGEGKAFNNLRSAIDSLEDDEPCIIYLYPGVYNLLEQWGVGTLGQMIPNNCYVQGVGNRNNIVVTAQLSEGQRDPYYSAINLTENCGIANFTIVTSYNRYAVHDDFDNAYEFGGSKPSTTIRRVYDMVIDGSNNCLNWTYGAGIKPGASLVCKNTIFIARGGYPNIPFSIHNMTGDTNPCHIEFEGCSFHGDNTGLTCRFTNVTNYNGYQTYGHTYVTFKDCDTTSVLFDNETPAGSGENTFYIKSDRELYATCGDNQTAGWDYIKAPNIENVYPYDLTISRGNAVFFNRYNQVARISLASAAERNKFFCGIACSGASALSNVIPVITHGVTDPKFIGLNVPSGVTGQYVKMNIDGSLSLTTTKDDDVIGWINNWGAVEIYAK